MEKENCDSCKFYRLVELGMGECRRNPPTMLTFTTVDALGQISTQLNVRQPAVKPDWWCGEFAAKPIKLAVVS